jgi:hypothetical protein
MPTNENAKSKNENGKESQDVKKEILQYRLTAHHHSNESTLKKCFTLGFCQPHPDIGLTGVHPQRLMSTFLQWIFRLNFTALFSLMCVMFFSFVIFFAGLITIAGNYDESCVRVGGNPFDSAGTPFADAFALSWTTFATVGYGSSNPALGYQNESPSKCFFASFLCCMISLVGILFHGFCGALLFGKVSR